ncbi:MAG TPA: hypothetical protein VLG44_07265 [Chlamydiales bacterium]|nr:hypothetical protein [Chlamydiales bacterium]
MAVTFQNIQPNLIMGDHRCGICNKSLKPAPSGKTPNPLDDSKPRRNKEIPRRIGLVAGNAPALAQIQRIKGHANCYFHEGCLNQHLANEDCCYSCKKWVYVPLPFILGKGFISTLTGAVLGAAPEVLIRTYMLGVSAIPELSAAMPEWLVRLVFPAFFAVASMELYSLNRRVGISKEISSAMQMALIIGIAASLPITSRYQECGFALGMGYMAYHSIRRAYNQGFKSSLTNLVGAVAGAALSFESFIYYFDKLHP